MALIFKFIAYIMFYARVQFTYTLITVFVWINYMGQHPKSNNLSVRSNLCEHISISQKVVHYDLILSLIDLSYDYFFFVYRSQIWSDIWYMTWWDIYIAVYKILSLDVVHWFTFVRLLRWVHFSDNNWSADVVYHLRHKWGNYVLKWKFH